MKSTSSRLLGSPLQDCLTFDVDRRPSMMEVVERLTAIDAASKLPQKSEAAKLSEATPPADVPRVALAT